MCLMHTWGRGYLGQCHLSHSSVFFPRPHLPSLCVPLPSHLRDFLQVSSEYPGDLLRNDGLVEYGSFLCKTTKLAEMVATYNATGILGQTNKARSGFPGTRHTEAGDPERSGWFSSN